MVQARNVVARKTFRRQDNNKWRARSRAPTIEDVSAVRSRAQETTETAEDADDERADCEQRGRRDRMERVASVSLRIALPGKRLARTAGAMPRKEFMTFPRISFRPPCFTLAALIGSR